MDITAYLPTLPITNSALIFFVVLTIILMSPVILDRLHIPHIIGLIFAGMVIGPHGINLLAYDASFEIFGNVGLLYLMFLVGLEMSVSDFKKYKREGTSFGIYTFLIPFVLGTASSLYLLKLGWQASLLLGTVYASHTLIAFPIISRYGVTRTRPVSVAIAGTVITEVISLTGMAVIIGVTEGGNGLLFWVRFIAGVTVYAAVLLYLYPRLTRWFFKKYNDHVLQFIFILALVFAAAYMAEVVGMIGIIGSFFAGIILTRYIPSVSPLMNRIEFVGNALFIPYFLIGVGMMINLSGFTSWHSISVAAIMIAVATATKWAAAWITQKSFRLPRTEGDMLLGLSISKAAATLAAMLIGYRIGLFDDAILNGTILMILVTCTLSAFITEKAAKKIAIESPAEPARARAAQGPVRILVPIVANAELTDNLINLAITLKTPGSKTPLYLLNVINEARQDSPSALKQSKEILVQGSKIAAASDIPVKTITRYDMNVAGGIIHTIKENDISEVLIGLHRKVNIADTFFGTKAETLLQGSKKMVTIAKMNIPANTITRIVVAIPPKAEHETGFTKWIYRICNMATQLGCRVIFYGHHDTLLQIKGRIYRAKRNIRAEYHDMESWADFLMLTGVVLEDDLFVIVSARQNSVSYNSDIDKLPSFLSRYFPGNNIAVLYPEQFGEEGEIMFFSDPLAINVRQNHEYLLRLRNTINHFMPKKKKKEN